MADHLIHVSKDIFWAHVRFEKHMNLQPFPDKYSTDWIDLRTRVLWGRVSEGYAGSIDGGKYYIYGSYIKPELSSSHVANDNSQEIQGASGDLFAGIGTMIKESSHG